MRLLVPMAAVSVCGTITPRSLAHALTPDFLEAGLGARILLVALLVAAGAAAWWRLTAYYEGRGYTRAMAEVAIVLSEFERSLPSVEEIQKFYSQSNPSR